MDPIIIAQLIATLAPEAQALIILIIHHFKAAPVVADPIPTPLPAPPAAP